MSPEERMRRRRAVRLHVIVALFTLLGLIVINAVTSSGYPWWIWVLMVWMPFVAVHTAWAMGLFARSKQGS